MRDTLPTTHFNEAARIKLLGTGSIFGVEKVCVVYWYGLLYGAGDSQRGGVVTVAVIIVVTEFINPELW